MRPPADLGKTAHSDLESELISGESFVIGARTSDSPFRRFRRRLVLTTDRFIVMDPQLFRYNLRSISLTSISSVETDRLSASGRLRLRGPDDLDESFHIRIDEAEQIAEALRDQLSQGKLDRNTT